MEESKFIKLVEDKIKDHEHLKSHPFACTVPEIYTYLEFMNCPTCGGIRGMVYYGMLYGRYYRCICCGDTFKKDLKAVVPFKTEEKYEN